MRLTIKGRLSSVTDTTGRGREIYLFLTHCDVPDHFQRRLPDNWSARPATITIEIDETALDRDQAREILEGLPADLQAVLEG